MQLSLMSPAPSGRAANATLPDGAGDPLKINRSGQPPWVRKLLSNYVIFSISLISPDFKM